MFKTKEIKTNTLGDKLKDTRESMKMSLGQVSEKTNIPSNYLEYLEAGDYDELPADVYIIAYLKKYAEILNLNIEEIIKQFKAEKGVIVDLPKKSKNDKGVVITPKRLTLVVGIIVIALIFGYFWHQLSYLLSPPSIKITQPASDLTTSQRFVEVSGQTESDKIEAKDRLGKTNTIIRRVMVTR